MRVPFRRGRPSPAMAVAFVALLAALSGTAVALPGSNTVDSGDLKRGAVKNSDIARSAVTGSKIRNGTITGSKIQNGTITGAKLANDTVTGALINESTLGTVPRADRANTAGTAERANTAGTASTAENANAVGGHAANSLVRVASAGADGVVLDGVSGTALSTAIAAPSAGFLVINAGSDVSNEPPADVVDCFIEVDGAESAPSRRTISSGAENTEQDCTTQTVVQVAAGDHSVDFEYTDVDTGTTVGASSLQVPFAAFGATGALP
jgi:hypothetical protein